MGYRKRLDGGYTVANAFRSYSDITPDSFRLFFKYLPALKSQLASFKFGFNARFFEEWPRPCRWPLDRPTIFETQRTLDPVPVASFNKTAIDKFRPIFPELAKLKVEQEWAGYIDVTPDVVPVISGVERM